MTKIRLIIFLITVFVVLTFGYFATLIARGYKFNSKELRFTPSGLLVVKSNPEAAQIFINSEFKTVTNNNLSLAPGTYDVTIKKEGYHTWNKRVTIEKEIVTEIDAGLFRTTPSLSAVTFTASTNPLPSSDFTKIAYAVPATIENLNQDKEGLWIMETVNLPLGFARDPRRITDGNINNSNWEWSYDGRQILLTTQSGSFLLDVSEFTPQASRINVAAKQNQIKAEWKKEEVNRLKAQLRGLPQKLEEILSEKSSNVVFSPDEHLILYSAKAQDTLPENLIKQVPGASTQKQDRAIRPYQIYVYDIKEDRNFWVDAQEENIQNCTYETPAIKISCSSTLSWFPTSRQIVKAEEGKITIMDYDGTNKQEVYSGSYVAPYAFPVVSEERLMILTNLGANSNLPNLYSLSLK